MTTNNLQSQIATAKQSDNQSNGILKSQIATSSWGGTRKLPYAFTREGIGMLSNVGFSVFIIQTHSVIPSDMTLCLNNEGGACSHCLRV